MIGIRAPLSAAIGTLGLALVLGPGGPDPAVDLAARRMVLERAERADASLASLEAVLVAALGEARRGAARIVSGDEPPGPHLRAGAAMLAPAGGTVTAARSAIAELNAARRARNPGATALQPPVAEGELASIAAQLEATAAAGDRFVEMRQRADEVTASLDRALDALERDDVAVAEEAVRMARSHHDAISEWEVDFVTLPVWIETTGAMIGAVEAIVGAVRDNDREAADEAARTFVALAEEAEVADRALRIAISEGGSAIAAAPLGRLAVALSAVGESRVALSSIVDAARR